jgi:NitT/TauT family transport system ATP-binding protein
MDNNIIELKDISKTFINAEKNELLVLNEINLSLAEGEIVALLGKSGSGKSTLLRIISGLVKPSQGTVNYHGEQIFDPAPGIAMVFQSFALMPWLTVLENVELGLEAKGIAPAERRKRALKAIDTIGLDGFESAYPKELSGGMRQRVGFARALVVNPEVLLMDEPFSALDVLTAETLRGDLLELWHEGRTNLKSILCVTHNIEESILLADRVIIFSNNPGEIQSIIKVDLPYPRHPESDEFKEVLDQIYAVMTTSERTRVVNAANNQKEEPTPDYAYRLPEVDVSELSSMLESMLSHQEDGLVRLPDLADDLHLDVNNLFPYTEVLDMLRFAKINEAGHIEFTKSGIKLASADIQIRKQIFAKHLLEYIPLARHIKSTIESHPGQRVTEEYFLEQLGAYFSEDESDRVMRTIIDWGRYAEIFAYDYDSGELSLENPQ